MNGFFTHAPGDRLGRDAGGVHYGGVESTDPLRPLLNRFRADRDAAAMEELVRRTRPKLLRIARRIGAPQDAEDSVQAAYHALLGRPELPDAPTLPWLITTVVRIAYRRKAVVAKQATLAERLARPQPQPSPAAGAAEAETARRIRSAVDRLPARYRNPLVLYYLEGLDGAETARLLDLSPSTLRTRLQRGRRLLRSSLGPATTYGLLVIPWLLLDGGRLLASAGPAHIGGAMQAKTAVAAVGVALAAGTLGIVVGTTVASGADDTPRGRVERGAREEITRLHAQVSERDEIILALRQRVERSQPLPNGPTASEATAGSAAKTKARSSTAAGLRLPGIEPRSIRINEEKARIAAGRLGVSDQELKIARTVFENAENLSDPQVQQAAIEELEGLGDRRTRAMLALVRAVEPKGIGIGGMRKALEAAHVAGQEPLLVELLKDGTTSRAIKTEVLRNIEPFDSPEVRDYLLERIAVETERYFFTSLVMALGRLKERRVVPEVRRLLQRDGDWLPFHYYGIVVLGQVGGSEAEALLLDHLRSGTLGNLTSALDALAKLNPAAARGEAQALLGRPELAKLPPKTLESIRAHAR